VTLVPYFEEKLGMMWIFGQPDNSAFNYNWYTTILIPFASHPAGYPDITVRILSLQKRK
jgi:hypothetical protein